MGNNPCKQMGVSGKIIGSKQLRALWQKYDKNKDGMLSREESLVFFKDFARAVGGTVTNEDASSTFDELAGGKGYLTASEFGRCSISASICVCTLV
jgi:Ca2+-binding EF-hand superfamily protein